MKYLEMIKNFYHLDEIEGNLLSFARSNPVQSLVVTSAYPQEGKTIASLIIAYALSQRSHAKVLLIDGNQYHPTLHKILEINSNKGINCVLNQKCQIDEAVHLIENSFYFLPFGTSDENYSNFLRDKSLNVLIDQFKVKYNYIIYDAPQVLEVSDTMLLAKNFDKTLLVVESEKTRWEVAQMVQEKLTNAGAEILGAILNQRKYYIPKIFY